ncbi:MAG: OmpA family protein, partial [Saprospiraceae bacterium]|nr:OmpA family protein [Saprospiraceae bacterium]
MKGYRTFSLLIGLVFLAECMWSQALPGNTGDPNNPELVNPSFEDIARASLPPKGWIDCGFPNESPPDVQPSGAWEVYRPAYHGYTYLGMVTRENDTWEAVGQHLNHPLLKGHCYTFSIYLCSSSEYWSAVAPDSVVNREMLPDDLPKKNFDQAIKLRIWGGDGYCDKKELLAESPTIQNTNWQKYSWKIEPKRDISHIVLEAFFKTPTLFPYNGNILIDHASNFSMVSCVDGEELIIPPSVRILQPIEKINPRLNRVKINAVVRNIKSKTQIKFRVNSAFIDVFDFDPNTGAFSTNLSLKEGKNTIWLYARNEEGEAQDETQVYIIERGSTAEETSPPPTEEPPVKPKKSEYKVLKSLNDGKQVATGQIIQIENLYFPADSSNLSNKSSYEVLDELFHYLEEHPQVTIEVRGHTSGGTRGQPINMKFSEELSRARAKSVALYLVRKGIPADRIQYKGYGPSQPIASNENAEGRRK